MMSGSTRGEQAVLSRGGKMGVLIRRFSPEGHYKIYWRVYTPRLR